MFGLEKYKNIFGKPNTGLHSLRAGIGAPLGALAASMAFAWAFGKSPQNNKAMGFKIAAMIVALIIILAVTAILGKDVALIDLLGTIAIAAAVSRSAGWSFVPTFAGLMIVAEAFHVMFGVKTPLSEF